MVVPGRGREDGIRLWPKRRKRADYDDSDHELVEGISPSMRSLVSVMLEWRRAKCRCCCWQRKARARRQRPGAFTNSRSGLGKGSGWFHALQWRLANSRIPAERTFWPAEVRFFWKSCPN